ncbi:energy transducer TonB [Rhodanobacter sp. B05]|nr:energy transducer TonB [Rhodanobacter sp. B05]
MKRWLLGVFCLLLSGAALAAGADAVRKRVQASMLVSGAVTVAPDGSLKSYVVDHPEQLPAPVVALIARDAPRWRFAPVVRDGEAVLAKAAMSLRIVAMPAGDGKYTLGIAGSHFGQPASNDDPTGRTIGAKQRQAPAYPRDAARAHVSGTVYVVMRVNRTGVVDEEAAEQVNLDEVGSDVEMRHWRTVLADAALNAARHWTFAPPTAGPEAARSAWQVRVPITFRLSEWGHPEPAEKYGDWHAYVPGPRNTPPWMHERSSSGSADALAAGGMVEVGKGLQLITPLNGA